MATTVAKRQEFLILIGIVTFLLGIYFLYFQSVEPFSIRERIKCPNVLVQEGNKILLYDTTKIKVPGVNPIQFENLEEYVEFMNWQKSQNIQCPALYLQHSFDPQGMDVYKMRPNVTDPQGGLNPGRNVQPQSLNPYANSETMTPGLLVDANHSDLSPFNKGSMPGFDGTSQYVGTTTPLDLMDRPDGNMLYSADAMESNWGGPAYSANAIQQGDFSGNV